MRSVKEDALCMLCRIAESETEELFQINQISFLTITFGMMNNM